MINIARYKSLSNIALSILLLCSIACGGNNETPLDIDDTVQAKDAQESAKVTAIGTAFLTSTPEHTVTAAPPTPTQFPKSTFTLTPTPTLIPIFTPTPTLIPATDVSSINDKEFRECVEDALTSEIATAVNIAGDGFYFSEGFDSSNLTDDQFTSIFNCGEKHGIFVTNSVVTETPSPESSSVGSSESQTLSSINDKAFRECVADTVTSEIAAAVNISGDGFYFSEDFDSSNLTDDQFTSIFNCGEKHGMFVANSVVTETQATESSSVESSESQTLSSINDKAFRECVAGTVTSEISVAVNIADDSIFFPEGFDSSNLTGDQIASIFSCVSIHGLTNTPDKGPLTENEQLFQSCVGTRSDIALDSLFHSLLRITEGGLPDFSQLGLRVVPPEYFQAVIACVPVVGDLLDAKPIPTEIMTKARLVGEQARPSVVLLETPDGIGTGFFITKTGSILTNHHVIEGFSTVTVWLLDGRSFEGRVLGGVQTPDAAVVQIDTSEEFIPLPIGSSDELEMGEWLITVGNPGDVGNWVTAVGDFIRTTMSGSGDGPLAKSLSVTVPGVQGSSGSPLLDLEGNVVGLIYGGFSREGKHIDGTPSFVLSDNVFDYVVSRSIATAVSIEDAMNVVSDVTGDKSIAQISAEIPIPSPPEMTPEIKSCVSSVIGQEESNDFNVTLGGLPNFSKMSATEISPSEFQLIVDCLPWVHLLRSPIRLVANDRQSLFEDDVIEKAYMVGQSVRNSVVVIETPTGNGTGWLMSDYGHIMTNQHVVEGRDSVTVRLLDGRRFEGPVIGQTTSPDVAVIKIDPPSGMVPLSVGTTTDLKDGDPLVVVGHPGIMGYWIATIGTFKKFENVIGDESIEWEGLITTVPGKQGSSGSPMFNLDGQVVGLVYGGQSLEPRDKNDPPKVASLEVREYFMPESLELVVSIEDAMKRAVDWVK